MPLSLLKLFHIFFLICLHCPKDPGKISSVLDFLSKKLEPFSDYTDSEDNYQKTKESLGLEPIDREKKTMFYLVKCQVLGGLSLLEYIDSHNVRLSRQREELIDVSVKIANLNKRGDVKGAKRHAPDGRKNRN